MFEREEEQKKDLTTQEIEKMLKDERIIKKDLGGGIVSLNFGRDIFFNADWDDITVKARGLFFNTKTKKIVARAYDKFFNLNEIDNLQQVIKKARFPINVWHKYNGFLGILGYNAEEDELFIASKSTNKGDFADMFRANLFEKLKDKEPQLKKFLKDFNCSMAFEVIHANDPHMIKYKNNDVILLDIIDNNIQFKAKDYETTKAIAGYFGFGVKQLVRRLGDAKELEEFVEEIEDENYSLNGEHLEGFVFEDRNHYMVKFKTGFYTFWKRMRGAVMRLAKIKEKYADLGDGVNVSYTKAKKIFSELRAKYIEIQQTTGRERRRHNKEEGFVIAKNNKYANFMKDLEKVRNDNFGRKGEMFFEFLMPKSAEEMRGKSIIELREEFEGK